MNKDLKYEKKELKRALESSFSMDLYVFPLLRMFEIYQIENPVIVGFSEEYEYLNLFIKNKQLDYKNCVVSINLLNTKRIKIKFCCKDYFDIYGIEDDSLFLIKRVFEGKDQRVEKIYTKTAKDRQIVLKGEEEYVRYKYIYVNSFLDASFYVTFRKNCLFQEGIFIKKLLEQKDKILSIEDLYTGISDLIGTHDLDVSITNQTPFGEESFLVQNNTLKGFKKVIQEGENLQIIEYDGTYLWETSKRDPNTNEVWQNMKRLIK